MSRCRNSSCYLHWIHLNNPIKVDFCKRCYQDEIIVDPVMFQWLSVDQKNTWVPGVAPSPPCLFAVLTSWNMWCHHPGAHTEHALTWFLQQPNHSSFLLPACSTNVLTLTKKTRESQKEWCLEYIWHPGCGGQQSLQFCLLSFYNMQVLFVPLWLTAAELQCF